MNVIKTHPRALSLSLAGLAAGLLLAGCETYKMGPPKVTQTEVSNPTFGFGGYTLPIPEGFTASTNYQPVNADPVVLAAYRGFFRKQPYFHPSGRQSRQEDRFQFSGDAFAIIFEACSVSVSSGSVSQFPGEGRRLGGSLVRSSGSPGQLPPDAQRNLLARWSRRECERLANQTWAGRPTKMDFGEPAIVRIGDRMAGYISTQITVNDRGTLISIVIEEYGILGYTDDTYIIRGIAAAVHKDRVAQLTRDLAMRLKI